MQFEKLLNVCNVYQPKTISTKNLISDGKYFVYGANGIIGRYNEYNHENAEVLLTCRGATCGNVNMSKPFSWINGNAMVVTPKNKTEIDKKYLAYCLMSVNKDTIITGTAQPQITRTNLVNFEIPICELPEQQRIVAKIEELFAELDNSVAMLKKVKEQLEVYSKSELMTLFKKIDGCEIQLLPNISKEIKVGIVVKPSAFYTDATDGIRAFRSANIREFFIDDNDWVYLSREGQLKHKRTIVHKGDVLIVRSGYPGTACVVSEEFDGCNAIDVLIVVPDTSKILSEYLCAYFNSPIFRQFVLGKKRGVAQAHLNVGVISKVEILVPKMSVQKEIVKCVGEILKFRERLSGIVDYSLQQADALRQSILKKAFEGEL